MNRTERQKLGLQRWVDKNCCGTCVYPTGFGKTTQALNACELLIKNKPNASILISVPTEVLKEQWMKQIEDRKITDNCNVQIINTIIKTQWNCDLFIQDEAHLVAAYTFKKIFQKVKYDLILCLTGTLERLDGKETIIKHYAPVCDTITMEEAVKNKWVAGVKEYAVLLDVDLTEYLVNDKKFNAYFAWFGWDFNIAMSCVTDYKFRIKYAKEINMPLKQLTANAYDWIRCMKNRKTFISSNPKKFEIANKILAARKDKKCIVFTSTIKDASLVNVNYVLHCKQTKSFNSDILEKFNNNTSASICSPKALNTGVDVKGLSVGIILNTNSSKITRNQSRGRICRFEEGKTAELFTLLLNKTKEIDWFKNSSSDNIIYITEAQLDDILAGKEIETRKREFTANKKYRF